jgi:hypothetical protein
MATVIGAYDTNEGSSQASLSTITADNIGKFTSLHYNEIPMAMKVVVSGTDTYVCLAAVGSLEANAVWRIKKIAVAGDVTTTTWADGDADFNNIATDPTLLSYS